MKKYFALLLAILMAAAIVCGCTQDTNQPNGGNAADGSNTGNGEPAVFRMLYDVENTTLNYLASGKELEHAVACNMVDGLVEFDNHSNVIPALAESWTTSDDGTVWTFKIREGQKWYDCNGKEIADVTANDWVSGLLNSNFRHAVMSALDREFVVQSAVDQESYKALLQRSITPAGSCYTDKGVDFADMPAFEGIEANFYNLDKANEYKAKAMEELSAKGVTFPVTMLISYQSGDKNYENECVIVKQQLEKALGTDFIKLELWAGPSENFLSETRSAGKYSFMRVRWGADYIDPQTWTDPFGGSTNPETGIEAGNTYNRWNLILDDELFRNNFTAITTNSVGNYADEFIASEDFAEVRAVLKEYYSLVDAGIQEGVDLTKRFDNFAKAEALLINNAMIVPCYIGPANYQATKLNIYEGAYAACGYAKLSYKGMHLQDHFISMEEYEKNLNSWTNGEY